MDHIHYMYRITNKTNQKVYIGQTINTIKRWAGHKNQAKKDNPNQLISVAIKKYGAEAFLFEIIASCSSYDDANYIEEELIKQYDCLAKNGKGYNISLGGETAPKSEAFKQMMRDYHANLSPEERARRNEIHRQSMLNVIATQGHPAQGTIRTPEQLKTLSQARKDHPVDYTPEIRQNMSLAHIGIKDSEETKQNKAKSQKERWIDKSYDGIKCQAEGCNVEGKAKYKIINNIRYCNMHGLRMLRNSILDKLPPHRCIGRVPHNRIKFSEEQISSILNDSRSICKISKDFSVTEKVIKRIKDGRY